MKTDLQPKKARGRTRTFDNDKTLDIAVQRYWSEGPSQVSVNEICKLAGVSKPSLYREFNSEDGLMAAALERYADQVLSSVLGMLDQGKGFQEVLDSLIDYTLRSSTESTPAGCLFAKMRLDRALLGPKTNEVIQALREKANAAFSLWLTKAQDEERVILPAPVALSAAYLDDQLTHLANRAIGGESKETLRELAKIAFGGFSAS